MVSGAAASVVSVSGDITNPNSTVGVGNTASMTDATTFDWQTGTCAIPVINNGYLFTINSGGGNALDYTGNISGAGGLTLVGCTYWGSLWDVHVQIGGTVANTYGGPTLIQQGTISLEKTAGVDALLGTITVGSHSDTARLLWTAHRQINTGADVTLKYFNPGSSYATHLTYLNLNGYTNVIHSLTMEAGTYVATGTGGLLSVTTLTLGANTYTTGAFGSDTPGGYVTGTGYILVGGSTPPDTVDLPSGPASPVPADGTTNLYPLNVALSWAASTHVVGYNLYVWPASGSEPATPTAVLQVSQYTMPAALADNTLYHWQAAATNSVGITNGPVWSFTTTARENISNATTPANPASPSDGVNIDACVGTGNTGTLIGATKTYWSSHGFTVALNLNTNALTVDSGGGNVPFYAYGSISGTGSVTFNTVLDVTKKIQVRGTNTYVGPTVVQRGWISLENTNGADALLGNITVGTSANGAGCLAWSAANQVNDDANVTLAVSGSFLQLSNFNETFNCLTQATGTYVATGGTNGLLRLNTLVLGSTTYTTGAFDSTTPGGYVTGSGYILVGGSPVPDLVDLPSIPSSPVPANGTTNIHPLNVALDWTDSTHVVGYNLYVWPASGSEPPTPTAALLASQYTMPTVLADNTLYSWQVVATNAVGPTNGPIWTFTTTARSHVSNVLTPVEPANPSAGVDIDTTVGLTNSALLVGLTQTHWAHHGFTVPVNLNGNQLIVDSGGGNVPFGAYGSISGSDTNDADAVIFNTLFDQTKKISVSGSNTYGGATLVQRGWISLENTNGGDALLGNITVGTATYGPACLAWTAPNQINDAADVILAVSGSALNLAGYADTIHSLTLGATMYVNTGTGGILTVTTLTNTGVAQAIGTYNAGNSAFVSGSGSVAILGSATTTVLTSSPNPATLGAPVTLTATITGQAASGTVTFMDGLDTLGTAPVSGGTATLATSALTFGDHSLTAVYGGDSFNQGSTSSPLSQLVNNHPPVTSDLALGALSGEPATLQIIGGKHAPTDPDNDPLTVTSVGPAANGTVTTDGANVTYTSANTFAGTDTFAYTVSDARGGLSTSTVTVSVVANGQGFNLVSADGSGMKYAGIPGFGYALEHTPSLTPPVVWTPLTTNVAGDNGVLTFTNTANGFYRTRWLP